MENCKFWTKGKHKADVKAKQPQSSVRPKMKQSCCAFKKGRKADVKAKQPQTIKRLSKNEAKLFGLLYRPFLY